MNALMEEPNYIFIYNSSLNLQNILALEKQQKKKEVKYIFY